MLKGIDPVLTGALLKVLDEMGHGDEILISDRNFPSFTTGRPVINLGEIDALRAGRAVLSVFPLDTFVESPVARMEIDGEPDTVSPAMATFHALAQEAHPAPFALAPLARHDFYARAKTVYAVLQTQESAPYANFILKKGVL